MTEQPPSAEAREIAEEVYNLDSLDDVARALDRFAERVCEQRVSAALAALTCAACGGPYPNSECGNLKNARDMGQPVPCAPAERPAPPIPELSVVRLTEAVEEIEAGTLGTIVHVYPGSALAETGYLVECQLGVVTVARSQIELPERPAPEGPQHTNEEIRQFVADLSLRGIGVEQPTQDTEQPGCGPALSKRQLGFRDGMRRAIQWLHDRANYEMNDPNAKAILNAAAFNLGGALSRGEFRKSGGPSALASTGEQPDKEEDFGEGSV